jgi:hypothetical protein
MEFNWCWLPEVTGKVKCAYYALLVTWWFGAGTWGVGYVLLLLLGSMYHAID